MRCRQTRWYVQLRRLLDAPITASASFRKPITQFLCSVFNCCIKFTVLHRFFNNFKHVDNFAPCAYFNSKLSLCKFQNFWTKAHTQC